MPLNLSVFKTRAITAIFFVIIMLLGICWNEHSFKFLLMVILIGCNGELLSLLKKKDGGWKLNHLVWAIFYVFVPITSLLQIGLKTNSLGLKIYDMWLPLILLSSLWINDTMAYLVGSWIGKTPLSKFSPKKTWEGTLGGIVLSVFVIATLTQFLPVSHNPFFWALFALTASITGTIGDLFESRLKRLANVKDSGNIMPGHGGFLDRFDSLLFAAPAVGLLLKLIGNP
jgi:phosphatidate cytidylyltransferase